MFSFVLRSGFFFFFFCFCWFLLDFAGFVGFCRVSKPCQILKLKRVLLSASPRVVDSGLEAPKWLGKGNSQRGACAQVGFVGFCGVSSNPAIKLCLRSSGLQGLVGFGRVRSVPHASLASARAQSPAKPQLRRVLAETQISPRTSF